MSLISSHDYHQRRAKRVLHLLRGLWGDDLPTGLDPELTILIDAVAGDDHLGSQDGYVVQSDRLTYETLALLLRRCSTPEIAARALPRELLSRVFAVSTHPDLEAPGIETPVTETPVTETPVTETPVTETPVTETPVTETPVTETPVTETPVTETPVINLPVVDFPVVEAPALDHPDPTLEECDVRGFADPSRAVGTWHLDGEQLLLSWDETCAALLERQDAPRCIEVMEEVEVWTHPEDRAAVAEGWQRCIQTAVPHQARFRALRPRGGYIPCFAAGRRIVDAAGKVHVVGFLQHDEHSRHRVS